LYSESPMRRAVQDVCSARLGCDLSHRHIASVLIYYLGHIYLT
jgi:hypothetical protein